jgi:transcriptional regulator with XRE-family HTH domain
VSRIVETRRTHHKHLVQWRLRVVQHSNMLDRNSNVMERPEKLRQRVSSRLRALRDELGFTIQKLADRSGVSRAMISRIERDESSPTTPLLNRLSVGLGVQLTTLLGDTSYRAPRMREHAPVATRLQQKLWIDPEGIRRRSLTPPDTAAALGESLLPDAVATLQLTDNLLPSRARITFAGQPGAAVRQQQIWLLSGELDLGSGATVRHLKQGDCMAMLLDQSWTVRNPGKKDARFLTAIAPIASPRGQA